MSGKDAIIIQRIKDELVFMRKSLENINREDFLTSESLQHIVMMALIIIGENVNRLSDDFKNNYPDIEWVQITAVRNIAAHGYWQLNMEQIWKALETDVPELELFFEGL